MISLRCRLEETFAIRNVSIEDSDQTARMRSLIRIFAGRICPKFFVVVFFSDVSHVSHFCGRLYKGEFLRKVTARFYDDCKSYYVY